MMSSLGGWIWSVVVLRPFGGGWIEIGQEVRGGSFARALDEGGQVWEGKGKHGSLEDVLKDLDRGIARRLKKHG
jgi:hypothetical protein